VGWKREEELYGTVLMLNKQQLSVKDFHMVEEVDEAFGARFPQKPARTVQQVVFMEKGADMMMDCIAVVDKE
jgi:hypothetical protein